MRYDPSDPMTTDEVYPNSPLQEVVLEVRFPGEPAIETHRDEFFEIVREEFPDVLLPFVQPGQAVALQPYHFRSSDESRSLITALNRFAYVTRRYPGWESYRNEALKWLTKFGEQFRLTRLTRTGLRYINKIPFAPGPMVPIHRFLNLGLSLGREVKQLRDASLYLVIPSGEIGSLSVRIGSDQGDPSRGIMFLDFDFAHEGALKFSDAEALFETSHTETKRFFEELITSEYRAYLEGKEIE